jgi:hypothetical protein
VPTYLREEGAKLNSGIRCKQTPFLSFRQKAKLSRSHRCSQARKLVIINNFFCSPILCNSNSKRGAISIETEYLAYQRGKSKSPVQHVSRHGKRTIFSFLETRLRFAPFSRCATPIAASGIVLLSDHWASVF